MNDRISTPFFAFGQQRPEFQVPVLNERAVRAGGGILFFFALVAFMNAWLTGNFAPTRVFVAAFLFDFAVRLFINPAFAPSLVLGQWMVRRQQPEWTGRTKGFAWAIGCSGAHHAVPGGGPAGDWPHQLAGVQPVPGAAVF
jgi:hypothetical protein